MTFCAAQSHHILVVDDESLFRNALRIVLQFDGHRVQTAATAEEALALFQPGVFDLVITDYSMPDMQGDELANALKRRAPGQPVLMLTAQAHAFDSPAPRLRSVDGLLEKPFRNESLRAAIARLASVQNLETALSR